MNVVNALVFYAFYKNQGRPICKMEGEISWKTAITHRPYTDILIITGSPHSLITGDIIRSTRFPGGSKRRRHHRTCPASFRLNNLILKIFCG
ncbi:hypothetical protein BCO26_2856 [Heyndrickxia coagulans 2-6]|nr:hypothetical protein BCO26_2856 [Heyndrickxia coagulans 2-6]